MWTGNDQSVWTYIYGKIRRYHKHHLPLTFSQLNAVSGFSQVLELLFTEKHSTYQPDFLKYSEVQDAG